MIPVVIKRVSLLEIWQDLGGDVSKHSIRDEFGLVLLLSVQVVAEALSL